MVRSLSKMCQNRVSCLSKVTYQRQLEHVRIVRELPFPCRVLRQLQRPTAFQQDFNVHPAIMLQRLDPAVKQTLLEEPNIGGAGQQCNCDNGMDRMLTSNIRYCNEARRYGPAQPTVAFAQGAKLFREERGAAHSDRETGEGESGSWRESRSIREKGDAYVAMFENVGESCFPMVSRM